MKPPGLALAGLMLCTWAAPAPAAETPPAPSGAAATPYRSPFTDYRAYREEPLRPWPEANREMGQLGGHGGHAKGGPPAAVPTAAGEAGESQPRRSGEPGRP